MEENEESPLDIENNKDNPTGDEQAIDTDAPVTSDQVPPEAIDDLPVAPVTYDGAQPEITDDISVAPVASNEVPSEITDTSVAPVASNEVPSEITDISVAPVASNEVPSEITDIPVAPVASNEVPPEITDAISVAPVASNEVPPEIADDTSVAPVASNEVPPEITDDLPAEVVQSSDGVHADAGEEKTVENDLVTEDMGDDEIKGHHEGDESVEPIADGMQQSDQVQENKPGSGRKESIRERVRREGRERARSQDDPSVKTELKSYEILKPRSAPDIPIFTRDDYPESYSSNTLKEDKLNQNTLRFLAQYTHLYPDRKPPFLNQLNDCGVSKCVCTYIRPTLLPYIDCYEWPGCGHFVADHIAYRPLSKPTETPESMLSPATVLRYQSANCFEMATLLCSLLAGAGYRSFVVSGYALRSVCLQDTLRMVCPDMMETGEDTTEQQTAKENKYAIKAHKELTSKYEEMMEERVREAEQKKEQELLDEELQKTNELEKEEIDPLFGMRVHAWVLIIPGARDIAEPFFIEPTTGVGMGIRCPEYLGIESLWSDDNYWVNLQYCLNGVRDLEYDLYNPAHWEFLLLREALSAAHPDEAETDLEEAILEADRQMDMPFSWVERLRVSKERYSERFPNGKKLTKYYRSKLEEFSPYSMKDGIVKRLTIYRNFTCENIVSTKEEFLHRGDRLISRETTQETGWVIEKFCPGREDALCEHRYAVLGNNPEDRRTMHYYYKARNDCLEIRKVEEGGLIEEEFVGRDDKLYQRETLVGTIQKKFGPQAAIRKPILSITERMHRNPRGEGDDGVSVRTFDVEDAKISVLFHACHGKITAERREFSKPHPDDKARLVPILEEAATSGFDTDPEAPPPRMLDLYHMMKAQMDGEEHAVIAVREAEDEIAELLNIRTQEEATLDLETTLWHSDLKPQIRADRKDLEEFIASQSTRLVEKDKDPLSPFIARLNVPESEMSTPNRFQLRDECMQGFRQRLVDKANRLQKQFEEQTEALQARQRWYQENYASLTEDEEEAYLTFCHDTMFRLHVLELLLERHKQMAPLKHQALEMKLRRDPRISGEVIKEEEEG